VDPVLASFSVIDILKPSFWPATIGGEGLEARHAACRDSHMRLFMHMIDKYQSTPPRNRPHVMVFEDDVNCTSNVLVEFADYFRTLPPDWDMVYLGGKLMARPFAPDGSYDISETQPWWRVDHISNTHAYLVRHTAWKKLVEGWQHVHAKEVDMTLTNLIHYRTVNAYIPPRPMCAQNTGYSDIASKVKTNTFEFDKKGQRQWLLGLKNRVTRHWEWETIPKNK